MNIQTTLMHIKRLIETYPNVRVIKTESLGGFSYINFNTPSRYSLSRIAYAAEASNVCVTVVAPQLFRYGYGEKMDDSELYHQMVLNNDVELPSPPSTLQIFGIFIARDLKALGLFSNEESDELQKSWNAIVM